MIWHNVKLFRGISLDAVQKEVADYLQVAKFDAVTFQPPVVVCDEIVILGHFIGHTEAEEKES